jgi:hypothetical protein
VSLIHDILSREAPGSAWCFLSCCKQLRSMHLRAVVLAIRAAWTDFKWIYKSLNVSSDRLLGSGAVCEPTSGIVIIPDSEVASPPDLKTPVEFAVNSRCQLVHDTTILLAQPSHELLSFKPTGALVRYVHTSPHTATCDVYFAHVSMSFDARLFANNNAMPHRDNNDFDRWMELRLNSLTSLAALRTQGP